MQILIAIIRIEGDIYTGSSPNLLGVSVTAKTFEEAQSGILDAMDKRIIELNGLHDSPKPISRRPIEETIGCVYKSEQWKDYECCNSAKKDGLCLIHWKKLYGHPYGITLKTCPLCKENDPNILRDTGSPCSFKLENPDWQTVLEEIKLKKGPELAKERRKIRTERFG